MTYSTKTNLDDMTPNELLDYLDQLCAVDLPQQIESIEQMKQASSLLSRLAGLYAFVVSMETRYKTEKRYWKQLDKTKYEQTLDKENIFHSKVETVKMNYNAVSRMLTIRKEIMEEVKMLGNVT